MENTNRPPGQHPGCLRHHGGGSCERRRTGSSGQLFVDRIATDRNRGQDGWVYKVNDFARNVGAADVAGPRLRNGDRVLWLYCVLDPTTRSCQRSLRVVPDATSGRRVGRCVRAHARMTTTGTSRPRPARAFRWVR